MPKDRLNHRLWARCGLGLILAAAGCRSTKSDVPPTPLSGAPPVSFSHDASPPQVNAFGGPASPYGPGPGSSSPYATSSSAAPSPSISPGVAMPSAGAPATGGGMPMEGLGGAAPAAGQPRGVMSLPGGGPTSP
jgi:hypothetical protein